MKIELENGIAVMAPTEEGLNRAGATRQEMAAWNAAKTADADRAAARARIASTAGDTMSLLGTTTDGTSLALLGTLAIAAAALEADTPEAWLAGTKTRLAALGDPVELMAAADGFLSSVASGEVRVPALAKGLAAVSDEIARRSTAVADALAVPEPDRS